jgi:SAM-dependent methyltransferase
MREPFLSEFVSAVREGAAARDIHDASREVGFAALRAGPVSEAFVGREVGRVGLHLKRLCPLLERHVGRAVSILDVGCGTGATTVALALSRLAADRVVGVDPNALSVAAARLRALGHGLDAGRVEFRVIHSGAPLPFADAEFDLTVSVSVLEFISRPGGRAFFASELVRVTRPGGHVFLSTPNDFRLREHHTGRWLGNFRRSDGHPWSSTPRAIRRMFHGCQAVTTAATEVAGHLPAPLRWAAGVARISPGLASLAMPWRRFVFRRD